MTTPQPAGAGKRRSKGPRQKHVPQRMCIACRGRSAKRGLTRIVRTPDGRVIVDATGKHNGRGAYLCDQTSCWERAISTQLLANALKTELDTDTAEMLRQFAAAMPTSEPSIVATAQEG